MKKVLRKSNLVAGILIMIVVCLGIVFAGDVIVKEGTLEAGNVDVTGTTESDKFKSTGCTATGTKAVAFGTLTEASGPYSTAMGYDTTAGGPGVSTAMGCWTTATGTVSTAMGYITTASGMYSTSIGYYTTASGSTSTAMGDHTEANGNSSIATGALTKASGDFSTAMGYQTTASGLWSTAMGSGVLAGTATRTTAIGGNFTNNVQDSFAVGFGQKDFSVVSGLVTVHNNLYVNGWVSAEELIDRSSFYDKDTYGKALDYVDDCSKTIKVNAQGEKEYNHEADPVFLKRWVTVKDYDKYTEEEVWDELLKRTITRRVYETHQELGSSVTTKISWLTQCIFELKQENQTLKDEITKLKTAVGIE